MRVRVRPRLRLRLRRRLTEAEAEAAEYTGAGGEVGAVDDGGGEVESRVDELVERLVEGGLNARVGEALDVVGPVEDGAKPLGLGVLAYALRVGAEVDARERGDLRDHLPLQEAVVVGAGRLDRAATPPAAALGDGARHAL